jgi:hypothetical protein
MKFRLLSICLIFFAATVAQASKIFIPMGATGQANHLKAYGIAFGALQNGVKVDWLLNYKGGSFSMEYDRNTAILCKQQGVSFTKMTDRQYARIVKEVQNPASNTEIVKLEKAPRIAVYTPLNKKPWDDAVTLALTYAGIPFDKIYADNVLAGDLEKYDWLHLHHEDFTGQYGRFWLQFGNEKWYQDDKKTMEDIAARNGYSKVSQLQLAVVKKINDFVSAGGNLFAMCTATETFDIALAAEGTDICDDVYDGDPADPNAQNKLDFSRCIAFKNFALSTDAYSSTQRSNIDNGNYRTSRKNNDYFTLLSAPAKLDHIPAMLCQNHVSNVKGFMGQTSSFRKDKLKPGVQILGEGLQNNDAKYIHGEKGNGTWTFYGGHDPEAYMHLVNDSATDLNLYPNSPGYRLILNNVLFPAAKKQIVPTVVVHDSASQPAARSNAAGKTEITETIQMLPNPTDNQLVISFMAAAGQPGRKISRVALVNMEGKEILSRSYQPAAQVSIELKNVVPGVYLVKVNDEYAGKIVKE